MLAGLLKKHGLKARLAESEAISAGHIASLDAAKTKLVCLSFLGIGSSSAQVRYLVRRLRRILPPGCLILVGYWAADAAGAPVKALEETAEADAYATSLQQASEIAVNAARRPGLELVTSRCTRRRSRRDEQRDKALVATESPLKIVPRPTDDRPSGAVPAMSRKPDPYGRDATRPYHIPLKGWWQVAQGCGAKAIATISR